VDFVDFCGYNTIMKKERIEFTILRYLGRPPSLFDDTAVVAVREIISAAGDKFDWGLFSEYAVFHKLSQTLYPNMKKFDNRQSSVECREFHASSSATQDKAEERITKTIPSKVINHFRGIFMANVSRNEFLAKELVKVNQLLEENGIEVLNWKGPTLAIQAYGDLALRQFRDLDTFVKHEDLEKVKDLHTEYNFANTIDKYHTEYYAGSGYDLVA
jgi:hypothetical protein